MSKEAKKDISISQKSNSIEELSLVEQSRISPNSNKKFCREMGNVIFSEIICKLMQDNGCDIKQLSKASGISLWKLRNIMDGDGCTTLQNMSDLLWAFGYELDINIKNPDSDIFGWGEIKKCEKEDIE